MDKTYSVPDVSCGHCKGAIEGALQPLSGVSRAVVDIDSKRVDVSFDPNLTPEDQVKAAIEGAGYPIAG